MQRKIGGIVARELSAVIGSDVRLERVDIGLFNRILIKGLHVSDRDGKEIARVNRLSASFELLPILKKKIRINTVQLFGFRIRLEKENENSELNIRYIIDAFGSGQKKENTPLDLRVNYVLLRNGALSYNVLSADTVPGRFDASHIYLNNISATISLKTFNSDSINLFVKRLAFREKNGFEMKRLSMQFRANRDKAILNKLSLQLHESELKIDSVWVNDKKGNLMKLDVQSPEYGMAINGSSLNLKELSYFVPFLSGIDKKVVIDMNIAGNQHKMNVDKLMIRSGNDLNVNIVSSFDDKRVNISVKEFFVGSNMFKSIEGLNRLMEKGTFRSPEYVRIKSEINGPYSGITAVNRITSSIGNIDSQIKFSADSSGIDLIGGKVRTKGLGLSELLPKSGLGNVEFNLSILTRSLNRDIAMSDMYIKGKIGKLEYNGYAYENIKLDGGVDRHLYKGMLELADRNGYLMVEGSLNRRKKLPETSVKVIVRDADIYATGLVKNNKYENTRLSFNMYANSLGNNIDNFNGKIEIDSLLFRRQNAVYRNKLICIGAETLSGKEKRLYAVSDFANAEVRGNFSYSNIVKSVKSVAEHFMPILESGKKTRHGRKTYRKINNNFTFNVTLDNTDFLEHVVMMPVEINHKAEIDGYFNEELNKFSINAFIPDIKVNGKFFESSSLTLKTIDSDSISLVVRTNVMMKNYSMLGVSLYSTFGHNSCRTDLFWGNNEKETYSGNLTASALLEKLDNRVRTSVHIGKSDFILKDSLWNIYPSEIVVDSGRIDISRLRLEHLHQFIDVSGKLSPYPEDTLRLGLNDIDLRYIFELANIRHVVDLSGGVTGTAYGNGILKELRINADLYVDNFSLNDSRLGDMNIKGLWDNSDKGIHIDAEVRDGDISSTYVNGVIHPIKPGDIDLTVNTSHVDLGFLRKYLANISSATSGRATGKIRIHGPFTGISLTGSAVAENFRFKVDILNTELCCSDTVRFLPDRIYMNNILVTDGVGNSGRATISLPHNNLKDLRYNVSANLNNMLVLNTKESPDLPFFGKVYASGYLNLYGGPGNLNVDADMTTGPNSEFTFSLGTVSSATENQFVTFVDKTKYWRTDTLYVPQSKKNKTLNNVADNDPNVNSDVRLNLNIDANPNVYIKLIMDPSAGDYIGGNGSGNIKVDFYNKGDVKMYGNYTINQGVYKFSLQEIIRKDFIIKSGSTVSFNGNPLDANLDINAIYTVNSVPLQDLGADVASQAGQTNVKVNCTMNLSGDLTRPTIKLGLELPNEGEEVERTVLNAISTEEQMNMQILYLLGIGKFYMQDYTGETQNSNALSSVLSSTISGQLNNMFSNLINSNNLNIGTNLSTGANGWTDMEFEGMLSGQLLNNRLLINGNFGYRDNALSQSNFIGDFEVEYLLTKNGNLRIKAYTKTNDRYYTKTTLTTQGLGFVFKRDFNNWRDFFGIENPYGKEDGN